jgi:hypothetical protein
MRYAIGAQAGQSVAYPAGKDAYLAVHTALCRNLREAIFWLRLTWLGGFGKFHAHASSI